MATEAPRKNEPEHPLVRENRILQMRLTLAQAFIGLWRRAFDAFQTHDVDFRNLKSFGETEGFDKAIASGDLEKGYTEIMGYIERVENDLKAALRRKNFQRVT